MFSSEQLGRLGDLVAKYVEVKSEILKAHAKDQLVQIITRLLVLFILAALVLFVLLLGSFALSFYLNEVLESSYLGFILVMGGFILVSFVVYLNRKGVIRALVFKTISKHVKTH